MARDYTTRSGLDINDASLPFYVTTEYCQTYIQKKINSALAEAKKKGQDYGSADVEVYTSESGKDFLPFLVILPTSVIDGGDSKNGKRGASIFDISDEDHSVILKPPFFEVFKKYVFTKDDDVLFKSQEWRRLTGTSAKAAFEVKRLRRPMKIKDNRSNKSVVMFIIDPLRLFSDMLYMDADKDPFKVRVANHKKLGRGKFGFNIVREKNKGNNKKRDRSIIDIVNNRMRSGR
jgi:hypothetical protein